MPRRPHLTRGRRPVAAVVLCGTLALATACGGKGPVAVTVPSPSPTGTAASACAAFVADLPSALADQGSRTVTPPGAPAAAYGDPAITVTCGVPLPADFQPGASCEVADGVGWYVPQEQYDDQSADVTATAVGYTPLVQLAIPHDYRPNGVAAAFAELAADVKAHLTLVPARARCV